MGRLSEPKQHLLGMVPEHSKEARALQKGIAKVPF
jgi:hypothetical protein